MVGCLQRGAFLSLAAGLTSLALATGSVTSAAAEGHDGSPTAVLGGFALGDGLEGTIDERSGAFRFTVPIGGVQLAWDSRAVFDDPHGLGAGWDWGLDRIHTHGGVQVTLASAGGVFAPDETHPSGLAGYGAEDVVFEQTRGALPSRGIDVPGLPGLREAVEYAFVLHELGGVATYFDAAGDPVVRLDRFGARTDWLWHDPTTHRLSAVADQHGMVTAIDWDTDPGRILVRPGANLEPGSEGAGSLWQVATDGGRVASVTDASGGRVSFGYEPGGSGLVNAVSGGSGALTRVAWRSHPDAVPRVARVATTDAAGTELSRREWEPGAGALPSGWPRHAGEHVTSPSMDPAFRYRTTLSDGATRVRSEYSSRHLLMSRATITTSSAGEHVVREQTLTYPEAYGDHSALPSNWSRPAAATVVVRDAAGRERRSSETFGFDARGRLTARSDDGGTVTTTEYDETVPAGAALPIGLQVAETTTGPDGQRQTTRHTLNADRTAVVATETLVGTPDSLVVGARTEFAVDDDGFVTRRRELPVDDGPAGDDPVGAPPRAPTETAWVRTVDATRGEVTIVETAGPGGPAEASVTEVTSLVHGGVLARTDALGNVERHRYDPIGRPLESADARGRVTTTVHETAQRHGRNAVTVTGPDRVAHTEIRDELGRSIRTTDNIDAGVAVAGHVRVAETRSYPEPGVVAATDAWGSTTTTRQDLFGRVVEVRSPSGLVQLTVYDDVRRTVTTALTPTGLLADAELVRTETRDRHDRAIGASGSRSDGIEVPAESTTYDGLGRVTATSEGAVHASIERDALGRPLREEIGGLTAMRRFDGFGRSVEKTVADDWSARSGGTRAHDELGRTVIETDQTGREVAMAYTADGLLETSATSDGARTEHTYDPVTRQLLTTTAMGPDREPVRTGYAYDAATDLVTEVFDHANRDETSLAYDHDAFGNITSIRYPDGNTVAHAYDQHGRRVGTTDIAGNVTRFEHTADGLLERAEQRAADGRLLAEVSYAYDAYRRVTTLTRGNGLVTAYTFSSASQIATETTTDASGQVRSHRTYTYDARGDLVRRVDTVASTTSGERGSRSTTTEYAYDATRRLIGSTVRDGSDSGAVARATSYRLSAAGDVLTETTTTAPGTPAAATRSQSFDYGPRGELTARTRSEPTTPGESTRQEQTWDVAGNLLHGLDGTRYEYDAANRPIRERAADGSVTATRYWPDGTRRERSTQHPDGLIETTGFYWDDANLLNDTHVRSGPTSQTGATADDAAQAAAEAGPGTAAYLFGTSRHARTTLQRGDDATTYYGTDRHGNVTDSTDEAGETTREVEYTDYGAATDSGATHGVHRDPFGYAGEYTDATGRQYLRARTYDPVSLQFTTRDTADRHNRYAFADLNPIMNVDPTGHASAPDAWHPVMLGLSVLFTAVIAVAAVASVPATFGSFGIGFAVGGVLTNAYSFAVSVGAIAVGAADRAGTPVDKGARSFFESPVAQLTELFSGVGFAAAMTFAAKSLPRLATWYRATFAAPEQHALANDMSNFADLGSLSLGERWKQLAASMDPAVEAPTPALNAAIDALLTDSVQLLRGDPLARIVNSVVTTSDGTVVRGFRAWLWWNRGIPLDLSERIYHHADIWVANRLAVANGMFPSLTQVASAHRKMTSFEMPQSAIEDAGLRQARLNDLRDRLALLIENPHSSTAF